MEKYVMALDQGTTSSRCVIFDWSGRIVGMSQNEFRQIFPNVGWVEHNPTEIWDSQLKTIKSALKSANISLLQIDSIGITNQRETTVVWNKHTGEPVYNAIVWQCRRTSDMVDKLVREKFDNVIKKKTGLVADAYFSATKIKWILDNVDGAREEADAGNLLFGTIDTWLMWKLSDGAIHATDYTNASRTMLYNIHTLKWDNEILQKFNIPEMMLPKVKNSSGIFGYTSAKVIGKEIPISGVAGDQQAALFGQCCFEPGDVKNTYGTGCFLLMNTGNRAVESANGILTTIAIGIDGRIQYALEGSVFVAGAVIQWLRDELHLIDNAAETEDYALKVNDTNGMYIVPAFTGLGAPYWDQYARGTVTGLTRGVTKEHFIRAALESLAYQTYDVLKAMENDAGIQMKELKVDGGASANNFLMQFQSDILNISVHRPEIIETTALGAAYLAGMATGYWNSLEDIKANRNEDREFVPAMKKENIKEKVNGWHKAVQCSRGWADNR